MADIEVVSQNPMTLAELKTKLEKLCKGKEEKSIRLSKVLDYASEFTDLRDADVKKLKEKLDALGIQRLKGKLISKIIDIQPKTIDELKILFVGENVTLKQDDLNKILDTLKE